MSEPIELFPIEPDPPGPRCGDMTPPGICQERMHPEARRWARAFSNATTEEILKRGWDRTFVWSRYGCCAAQCHNSISWFTLGGPRGPVALMEYSPAGTWTDHEYMNLRVGVDDMYFHNVPKGIQRYYRFRKDGTVNVARAAQHFVSLLAMAKP